MYQQGTGSVSFLKHYYIQQYVQVLPIIDILSTFMGGSRKFCQGGPDNIFLVKVFHRGPYEPSVRTSLEMQLGGPPLDPPMTLILYHSKIH